jgi:hypothetical protein
METCQINSIKGRSCYCTVTAEDVAVCLSVCCDAVFVCCVIFIQTIQTNKVIFIEQTVIKSGVTSVLNLNGQTDSVFGEQAKLFVLSHTI